MIVKRKHIFSTINLQNVASAALLSVLMIILMSTGMAVVSGTMNIDAETHESHAVAELNGGSTSDGVGSNASDLTASTSDSQLGTRTTSEIEGMRILEQPTNESRLIGTAVNPDDKTTFKIGVENQNGELIEEIDRDEAVTVELIPKGNDDRDRVTVAQGVAIADGTATVDLRDFSGGSELGPAGPLGGYEIKATIDADATAADGPITIRGETVELVHRSIEVAGDGTSTFATPIDLKTDVRTTFTTGDTPDPNASFTASSDGPGLVAENPIEAASISRFDGPGLGESGLEGQYESGFADNQAQQVHQGYFLQIDSGNNTRETERIGLVYRESGLDQIDTFELKPGIHLLGTAPASADPREYQASVAQDAGVNISTAFEPGTGGSITSDTEVRSTDPYWVVTEEGIQDRLVFVPRFDPEGPTLPPDDPSLEGIRLELEDGNITENEETSATVVAEFEDDTEDDVTRSADIESDDPEVATVDNATVIGQGEGTTEIEAEFEGENAQTELDVQGVQTTAGDQRIQSESLISTDTLAITEPTDESETVGQTQSSIYSGVRLSEIDYSTSNQDAELRIEQSEGPPADLPQEAPSTDTILSHFEVDSTGSINEFDDVEIVFEVERDVVQDPDAVEVYRYTDQWESVGLSVEELNEHYRVEASADGFSTYAVSSDIELFDDEADGPDIIEDIETFNELETDSGYLQSFDVDIEVDVDAADKIDDPYVNLRLDETHLETRPVDPWLDGTVRVTIDWLDLHELSRDTYNLRANIRDGPLPTDNRVDNKSTQIQLDVLNSENLDEIEIDQTAAAFHEEIASSEQYRNFSETKFNSRYHHDLAVARGDVAADVLNQQIEDMVQPSMTDVGVDYALSKIPGGDAISATSTMIDAATFAAGTGMMAERQSTAIYLQETSGETTELREQLLQLQRNTEQLHEARTNGEDEVVDELLAERKVLLEEIHDHIPDHVEAVHQAVVQQSVGVEDRHSYAELRAYADLLRTTVVTDYALTTGELTGSPGSLLRSDTMPTHGWERDDRSVVYDTLAFPGDFAVYQVNVSEQQADDTAVFRLQSFDSGIIENFDAFKTGDQVVDPAEATGEQFGGLGEEYNWQTRTLNIEEPGEYFITVRATEGVGMYRLVGSTESGFIETRFDEAVSIDPITRADPPQTRPELELEDHPPQLDLTETDSTVYVTDDSDIELTWNALSGETPPGEQEYRYRVDNGTGFNELSDWKTASDDGDVELDIDVTEGVNRVQLVVRNNQFMQTVDSVDVVKDTTVPQTHLTTDSDPTSQAVFAKVVSLDEDGNVVTDRRIDSLELQYRELGDDKWTDWKTIEDTENLGRLEFERAGEFELRARSFNVTEKPGEWDTTAFSYTSSPSITATEAPEEFSISSSGSATQRFTSNDSVHIAWEVESDIEADLEYRARVDDESSWTSWQDVDTDGEVEKSFSELPEGDHVARLQVRDEFEQTSEDEVEFTITRSDPQLVINGTEDVEQLRAEITVDQPVKTIEAEYRDTDEDSWKHLTNQSHVSEGETRLSESIDPGTYDIRVRPTDYLGNTGQYANGQAISVPGETENMNETASGGSSTRTQTVGSSNLIDLDFVTGGGGDVDVVTGDMLVNVYTTTRNVRGEQLESIELTEQRSQTLEVDAPGPLLEDADGLEIEVVGEGTVVLESLRAFEAELDSPEVEVAPDDPAIEDAVSLSIDKDQYVAGSIDTIEWDVTGDGTVDETGAEVVHTFESYGNQTVEVTVTDTFDRSVTAERELFVNAPPLPEADIPESKQTLEELTIDASETVDPTETNLTYTWEIVDETGERTIDATSEQPILNVSFEDSGHYTLELKVTDEFGAVNSITEEFKIKNRPPVAIANVSEKMMPTDAPVADDPIVLTGEDSFDPDGKITQYEWMIGEKSLDGQTVNTTLDAGEQSVSLTVTDDDGATNTTNLTVDVRERPTANINELVGPTTSTAGIFETSANTDPTGTIEEYQWTINGESIDQDRAVLNHEFAEAGTHTLSVSITDDVGAGASDSIETEVEPFEADAGANQTLFTGQAVEFNGTNTILPENENATFSWNFGDGVSDTGQTVTHTYETAGTYTATLTVELERGVTASDSVTVGISDDEPLSYNLEEGTGTDLNNFVSGYPDGEIIGSEFEWQDAPEESGNEHSLQMGGSTYANTGITEQTDDLAIEMWFRHDTGGNLHYMWNDFEGGSSGFRMFTNGIADEGIYVRGIPGQGDLIWSGNIQNDQWNHIVFTLDSDSDESRLYINGNRVETGYYDGTVVLDGLRIMGDGGSFRSTASYDSYSFTYDILDDDEVKDRYEAFVGTD